MIDYARILREDARLRLLAALEEQPDGRLNADLLRLVLEAHGIDKPREWVADQLRWLEGMGAVRLIAAGDVLVAELTERGARHLSRAEPIEGVRRAPRPEV